MNNTFVCTVNFTFSLSLNASDISTTKELSASKSTVCELSDLGYIKQKHDSIISCVKFKNHFLFIT